MTLLHYQKPDIRHGITVARVCNLELSFAVNARRRFLMEELERVELEMAWYEDYEGAVDSEYFALRQYSFLAEERAKINLELHRMKSATKAKEGITEDDIEAARSVDVATLIDFTRGKAIAFCHEDKNPSMFHATRTNTAQCPVCDKKFDSIGILMERDGMGFIEAVKQLSGR